MFAGNVCSTALFFRLNLHHVLLTQHTLYITFFGNRNDYIMIGKHQLFAVIYFSLCVVIKDVLVPNWRPLLCGLGEARALRGVMLF